MREVPYIESVGQLIWWLNELVMLGEIDDGLPVVVHRCPQCIDHLENKGQAEYEGFNIELKQIDQWMYGVVLS